MLRDGQKRKKEKENRSVVARGWRWEGINHSGALRGDINVHLDCGGSYRTYIKHSK